MEKKSRRRNGRPRESVKSGMSKVTTESIIRNVEMNNVLGRSRSTASNEEIDPKNIKKFHMNVAIPPGVYPETFVRQKLAAANIDPNRLVDLEWDSISPEDANKENRSHMSDGEGLDHTTLLVKQPERQQQHQQLMQNLARTYEIISYHADSIQQVFLYQLE